MKLARREEEVLLALRRGKRIDDAPGGGPVVSGRGMPPRRIRARTMRVLCAHGLITYAANGYQLTALGVKEAERLEFADECSGEVCRIWFYLEEFCLSLARLNPAGDTPSWLEIELGQAGWDGILELDPRDDERVAWALEQGVAPGQPFFMEIRPPRYSKVGNSFDGEDWDVEYNTTFVKVDPMPAPEAADQWEAWIKAGYLEAA